MGLSRANYSGVNPNSVPGPVQCSFMTLFSAHNKWTQREREVYTWYLVVLPKRKALNELQLENSKQKHFPPLFWTFSHPCSDGCCATKQICKERVWYASGFICLHCTSPILCHVVLEHSAKELTIKFETVKLKRNCQMPDGSLEKKDLCLFDGGKRGRENFPKSLQTWECEEMESGRGNEVTELYHMMRRRLTQESQCFSAISN